MTPAEISGLVGAIVAVLGAATAWLKARTAAGHADRAERAAAAVAQPHPDDPQPAPRARRRRNGIYWPGVVDRWLKAAGVALIVSGLIAGNILLWRAVG